MEFVLGAAKLKSETPLVSRKPESQIPKCMSAYIGHSLSQTASMCILGEEVDF